MPNVAQVARPTAPAQTPTPASDAQDGVPVLLIPGWSDDERRLVALNGRLTSAGWAQGRVQMLSFRDPVGSNRDHAREIAEAVLTLKLRTGAERIDIVAHSMGGLATRYFLQNGGDAHVRRVVFLATPHRGTVSAHFAWGEGAREMEPRSAFLLGLIRAHPVPPGVRAITIRTPLDLHVVPLESATLPGIPNLEVCCPTHAGLLDDDKTFELIARFLKDVR
jgi:triacylglycerol lipase